MAIRHRRADSLWQLARTNSLFNKCLDLFPIHRQRYLSDGHHKPWYVSSAQPRADRVAQAPLQAPVKAVAVAHDDEEEDGLVGINALPASPDAESCFDCLVEGVGFGDGVDL